MIKKSILSIRMAPVFILITFLGCNSNESETKKFEIVTNHIENGIISDMLMIYKDENSRFPQEMGELESLYGNGETAFGFDSVSIKAYLMDPFADDKFKYYTPDGNSFILYSVGPDGTDDNLDIVKSNINLSEIKELFNNYDSLTSKGDLLIYLCCE